MKNLENLQKVIQTLNDVNRLRIIKIIGNNTCSVSSIVDKTALSQPLVSHHLRVLKQAGILTTSRQGPFVYYSIRNKKILSILGALSDLVQENKKSNPAATAGKK